MVPLGPSHGHQDNDRHKAAKRAFVTRDVPDCQIRWN